MFHGSIWGGVKLCLGGLSPPKPPRFGQPGADTAVGAVTASFETWKHRKMETKIEKWKIYLLRIMKGSFLMFFRNFIVELSFVWVRLPKILKNLFDWNINKYFRFFGAFIKCRIRYRTFEFDLLKNYFRRDIDLFCILRCVWMWSFMVVNIGSPRPCGCAESPKA